MQGLKMRVPDVPAYLAMPRACGANTAPIAFAEVYLALQNGTVEAQENPLTTIEAKKFYEVQKYIVLTGHIVDHLNTVISKSLWDQLSEEDRKIFTEVALEAAARASKQIQTREAELVQFFKDKGLEVTEVNKVEFKDAVMKNVPFEQYGYRKKTGTASRPSSRPREPSFRSGPVVGPADPRWAGPPPAWRPRRRAFRNTEVGGK